MMLQENAKISKQIIAISNSTKNDISEFLKISENKISVTHLAASDMFIKLNLDEIDKSVLESIK
ncbi:MAG: hypothetical protein ACYDIA_15915 [Candidatus Humimicrobiaceae bacterium]